MTLREISSSIGNLFSNFFNAVLDFDLMNILVAIFIAGFLIMFPWLIYKIAIDIKLNFKKSNILKKIGLIFSLAFFVIFFVGAIAIYFW